MNFKLNNKKGQLLLELMIAVTVFALTVFYFIMTLKNVLLKKSDYRDRIAASYYAQEGMEVAYNLGVNMDWTSFKNKAYNSESEAMANPYHSELNPVSLASGEKEFEGKYMQKIFLQSDGEKVIVTSRVEWLEDSNLENIDYKTYLIQLNDN